MIPTSVTNLPLSCLKEGAIEEMVQHALGQVLANVRDPNTSAEAKRSVTVKMDCLPAGDRSAILLDITVTTKLAGFSPVKTLLTIGDDGRGHYTAHEPEQARLPGLAAVSDFPDKKK
jgi:hypothetical protein